nr:hypothetical protein ECPA41_5980 [Escherichia coli PA41]
MAITFSILFSTVVLPDCAPATAEAPESPTRPPARPAATVASVETTCFSVRIVHRNDTLHTDLLTFQLTHIVSVFYRNQKGTSLKVSASYSSLGLSISDIQYGISVIIIFIS